MHSPILPKNTPGTPVHSTFPMNLARKLFLRMPYQDSDGNVYIRFQNELDPDAMKIFLAWVLECVKSQNLVYLSSVESIRANGFFSESLINLKDVASYFGCPEFCQLAKIQLKPLAKKEKKLSRASQKTTKISRADDQTMSGGIELGDLNGYGTGFHSDWK